MSKKKLRKRLKKYIAALERVDQISDPEDSPYIKGYDQALGNVTHSLKRILEDTK